MFVFSFYTKQAILTRRSTVLCLFLQYEFPEHTNRQKNGREKLVSNFVNTNKDVTGCSVKILKNFPVIFVTSKKLNKWENYRKKMALILY